jgi:DNA-binding SARP family transcriptional activator
VDLASAPRVVLLDGFAVHLGDRGTESQVGPLPHGVQRLVAHLCLAERPARTAVAGHLWPDASDDRAQGSLRSALWRLQRVAPGLIVVSGGALSLSPRVRVDVHELSDWANRVLDPRVPVGELAVLDTELRGDLLPGWYDDWVLLERERLRQLRMYAFERLANSFAVDGRHAEALQAAYEAIRAEPLRESAHRTLVHVHLVEGNVSEAIRAYETYRRLLDDELGVRPTDQMARLVRGLCRRPRDCAAPPAHLRR